MNNMEKGIRLINRLGSRMVLLLIFEKLSIEQQSEYVNGLAKRFGVEFKED